MPHYIENFRFELNEESGNICAKGPKNGKFLVQGIVKMVSLFEPLELAPFYQIGLQSTYMAKFQFVIVNKQFRLDFLQTFSNS